MPSGVKEIRVFKKLESKHPMRTWTPGWQQVIVIDLFNVHEVLVNRLGGLSLPRKSVVRLTDRPDMTLDVFTVDVKQQSNNNNNCSMRLSGLTIEVGVAHRGC